jgi:signal transduction histidine kinase
MLAAQAKRMSRLISVLLDLSRLRNRTLVIDPNPLDLGALVLELVEELMPTLTRHRIAFVDLDERLVVQGDALRLEEVLYNLIQDALKYSPDGSPVRVRLERNGGRACVAVIDEGIGTPSEVLPHLGTPYFRAADGQDKSGSGMGIGLFIAKELLALHGGCLEVESVVGKGSTFRLCLPLADPP